MDRKFYEYKPGGIIRILPTIDRVNNVIILDHSSYLYDERIRQKSDNITKYAQALSRIFKNSKTTENRKRKIKKIYDNICSDKI